MYIYAYLYIHSYIENWNWRSGIKFIKRHCIGYVDMQKWYLRKTDVETRRFKTCFMINQKMKYGWA